MFRFCLNMNYGYVRKARTKPKDEIWHFLLHNTVSIILWGAIAYGSRSPLVYIRGNINACYYVDNVLRLSLDSYYWGLTNTIFQKDTTSPHISAITTEFLNHAQLKRLQWASRSADLSAIELVMEYDVYPPQSLSVLQHNINVSLRYHNINHLINFMPRRFKKCIIKYKFVVCECYLLKFPSIICN